MVTHLHACFSLHLELEPEHSTKSTHKLVNLDDRVQPRTTGVF